MIVRFEDESGNRSHRFSEPAMVPAGHLQWRQAASVCCGSGSGETYDLVTGRLLFENEFTASTTTVGLPGGTGPFWSDLTLAEIQQVRGHGWSPWSSYGSDFPESILWGTYASSYEVSFSYTESFDPHRLGQEQVTEVKVRLAPSSGIVFANLTTHLFAGDDYRWDYIVRSQVDPDTGIPVERHQAYVLTWDNGTSDTMWDRVTTFSISDPGTDPLPFQGQHHVPIATGPDQTLEYGGFDLWPTEESPHALFDVAQAAEVAWNVEDPDVRAFRADAQDPHLSSAGMSMGAGVTQWQLIFVEAEGRGVRIDLTGTQVPHGPLVVLDVDVEPLNGLWYSHIDAPKRTTALLAAPGQLASAHDLALAQITPQVHGYSWSVTGFGHALGELDTWWSTPSGNSRIQLSTGLGSGIVTSYWGEWATVDTPDLL